MDFGRHELIFLSDYFYFWLGNRQFFELRYLSSGKKGKFP